MVTITLTGASIASAVGVKADPSTTFSTSPPFYASVIAAGPVFYGRASSATYFDNTGTLQTVGNDTVRPGYYWDGVSSWVAGGNLIEPAATNGIPNSTMTGTVLSVPIIPVSISTITFSTTTATVTTSSAHNLNTSQIVVVGGASPAAYNGTFTITKLSSTQFTYIMASTPGGNASPVGSYTARTLGTGPSGGWSLQAGSGVTVCRTDVNAENGISYADFHFIGHTTATVPLVVYFTTSTAIAAAQNQTWTLSTYLELVAGSFGTPSSFLLDVSERDAGGANLTTHGKTIGVPAGGLLATQLAQSTVTLTNASTAYVMPYLLLSYPSGVDVDFTMRVGMPQMEQNAQATSPIATSSGAVSRAADDYLSNIYQDTISHLYLDPVTQGFYSRASTASYFDAVGNVQTASIDASRINYYWDGGPSWKYGGYLIEPASTNYIRNSTATGSVNGTPGTMPTSWAWTTKGGLTTSIIGAGTENDFGYVDIQAVGTTSSTYAELRFDNGTTAQYAPALINQTWTQSLYCKVVAGDLTNITHFQIITWIVDSGDGLLSAPAGNFTPPSSGDLSASPALHSFTTTNASTAYVKARMRLTFNSGVGVNVTFRIAGIQLEQLGEASSFIPTSSGPLSRAGDIYQSPLTGGLGEQIEMGISGVAATGGVGSVSHANSIFVPSITWTTAEGDITLSETETLAGAAASWTAGDIALDTAIALTGAAITSAQGVVTTSEAEIPTDISASWAAGDISEAVTTNLSGVAVSSAAGITDKSLSLTLPAQDVTTAVGSPSVTAKVDIPSTAASWIAGDTAMAIVVALTGAAITSAQGAIMAGQAVLMDGIDASWAAGDISEAVTTNLSGVAVSSAAGITDKSPSLTLPTTAVTTANGLPSVIAKLNLSGDVISTAAGDIAISIPVAVLGASVATAQGSLIAGQAVMVDGIAASWAAGDISEAVTTNLSGMAISSAANGIATSTPLILTGATTITTAVASVIPTAEMNLSGNDISTAAGDITEVLSGSVPGAAVVMATNVISNALSIELTGVAMTAVGAGVAEAEDVPVSGLPVSLTAGAVDAVAVIDLASIPMATAAGTLALSTSEFPDVDSVAISTAIATVIPAASIALNGVALTSAAAGANDAISVVVTAADTMSLSAGSIDCEAALPLSGLVIATASGTIIHSASSTLPSESMATDAAAVGTDIAAPLSGLPVNVEFGAVSETVAPTLVAVPIELQLGTAHSDATQSLAGSAMTTTAGDSPDESVSLTPTGEMIASSTGAVRMINESVLDSAPIIVSANGVMSPLVIVSLTGLGMSGQTSVVAKQLTVPAPAPAGTLLHLGTMTQKTLGFYYNVAILS